MVVTAQHLATRGRRRRAEGRRQRRRRRGRGRLRAGGGLSGRRQSRRRRLHDASSSPTAARPSSTSARRRRSPRPPTCTSTRTATSSRARAPTAISRSACRAPCRASNSRAAKYGTMKRADADRAGDPLRARTASCSSRATSTCSRRRPTTFRKDPATAAIFLERRRAVQRRASGWCRRISRATLRRSPRAARPASTRAPVGAAIVASEPGRQGHHHAGRPRPVQDARARRRSSATTAATTSSRRRRRARAASSSARSSTSSKAIRCKDLGFRSAQAVHYQIEAMRHAYVDRNSYLGDPDFVKNPLDRLLDKDYAGEDPRRDRPGQGRRLAGHQARRAAARRQQHDALLDRRQVGQRGRRSPTR